MFQVVELMLGLAFGKPTHLGVFEQLEIVVKKKPSLMVAKLGKGFIALKLMLYRNI